MSTETKPLQRPHPAIDFLDTVSDPLCNLWSRWQDEREYENLADYALPLQKLAMPHGHEIIAMTDKPFGFTARIAGLQYWFKVKSTGRYLHVSVKRL